MLRAADIVARRLYQAGCRHAFGMPGGEVLTLIDALGAAGIDFVLAKHENNAGFMAEAAWHATGAPGVLVVTLGPGAMNAVNVIANAHQDRVPLIALTGCVDAEEAESYTHQIVDHRAVLGPLTKVSLRLTAGAADIVVDKAVTMALEPRPGPAHVDVPISVATAAATPARHRRPPAAPMTPAPGPTLDAPRAWLAAARRPLALIGLDAVNEDAGPTLRPILERLGIPFVTTYKAKGILPEDHPLCLGAAGLSPLADSHLLPMVKSADLILGLGYDPIEMRVGWREIWDPEAVPVIDIAAAPNHHYMHRARANFVAGVATTIAVLAEGVASRDTWPDGEIAALKSALAAAFPTDEPWGPAAVIAECRACLPAETIATADSGAHRILLSQMWSCPAPRTLLQSSGLCTMGCAVPLAMGMSLQRPEMPVVAFTGDAGFLMVAGELSTAAELGLRTIFVVFVDGSLALIETKQRARQLPNAGVDFARHDLAALGRALGGEGHNVRDREGLHAALREARKSPSFTVIAAEIDRQAYDGRI